MPIILAADLLLHNRTPNPLKNLKEIPVKAIRDCLN
jgi:hypothetical protein